MTGAGRTVVVTGAASGIGRATARRFAALGDRVALVDHDRDGLDVVVGELTERGATAAPFAFDLVDAERFGEVVESVAATFGRVEVLVNNAGIGVAAEVPDTDPDDWDRTLAVNLTAVFHTCRAVLPSMIDAGSGVIVNVSSVAAVVGVRRRAAYCASKAGVLGLTRAIAVDHAHQGIRANAICPGTVETEWIDKILAGADDPTGTRRAMEQRQLDGRMGDPDEVAAGIVFLAADDGRFMNGAGLVMDGGMSAI